ncbi:MAG: hypothetical protein V1494_00280 [Candidatus Diapherotrites archaeon]
MESVEQKVNSIFERNKRVETDKAWELSKTRRAINAFATYVIVLYFLLLINAPEPYLNSLVPAGAYLIQNTSMPFIKKLWVERVYKR